MALAPSNHLMPAKPSQASAEKLFVQGSRWQKPMIFKTLSPLIPLGVKAKCLTPQKPAL
jgi:hypothetical protein